MGQRPKTNRWKMTIVVPWAFVMCIGVLLFCCEGGMGQPSTTPGVPAVDGGVCIDEDYDGFGEGCLAGSDCDDTDTTRNTDCSSTNPHPDGPPGIGVSPSDNPGGTGTGDGGTSGTGDGGTGGTDDRTPWNPTPETSANVYVNDDGSLMLSSDFDITPAVWIANDDEGTVSRLDVDSGHEIGRYPAVASGAEERTDPSRTAVDFRGDCWVANRFRETGMVGQVTKIAGHEQDCIDRNGNGEIDTSRDLNGNGVIDLGTDEFLDSEDECVLFSTEVGGEYGIPRALAIAPDPRGNSSGGNAWVGLNYGERNHGERATAEIDGDTGEVLQIIPLPLNPYGALASKYEGQVWFTNARWQSNLPDNPPAIVSVDYRTGEVSPRYEVEADDGGCVGTYGLTIDAESHVWVAGHDCGRAFRFDPRTSDWMTVELGDVGVSRGLVADRDGWIWVAHSRDCGRNRCGIITRFFGEDGSDREYYYLPEGNGTIGVDVDVNGRIWVVNKATNSASRIDPVTGVIDEFPTGDGPYTYSDFTGHSLLLQFPRGYYRTTVDACPSAQWDEVFLDARIPEGTAIEVRVRTADDPIELNNAEWYGPWTEFPGNLQGPPGPVPHGQYLEVELTLLTLTDELASPSVRSIDFTYTCPLI